MQTEIALSETDPARMRHALQLIAESTDRASRMVNQLLTLARAEASHEKLHRVVSLDLDALARGVAEEWVVRALAKRIDFGFEDSGRPLWIEGVPLLLHELLNNLVDNAIKYTPPGGHVTLGLRADHNPISGWDTQPTARLSWNVQPNHALWGALSRAARAPSRADSGLNRIVGYQPPIPPFVDSPLAVDVTQIFRTHPECYDSETLALMEDRRDPFGFRQMRYIRDVEDSKALNFLRDSAVIISASGMCESGRILHHLKNNIEEPDNTILFSGFQAENTLGRRILDGNRRVRIFGEEYDVRAKVEKIEGYSAHADCDELVAWAGHFDPKRLQHIFLVHGELDSAEALSKLALSLIHI